MRHLVEHFFIVLLFIAPMSALAQDLGDSTSTGQASVFGAYEFGEMATNRFQNFAGEIGFRFKNDHVIRLVNMNVKLTEKHLSSPFIIAVDGNNVTGLFQGFELFYDIPIYRFKKGGRIVYGGFSVGHYTSEYSHTILDESVSLESASAGIGLVYREDNVFNLKGLYYTLMIPVRYYFDPLDETTLGESTVRELKIENNIWFFVGYNYGF